MKSNIKNLTIHTKKWIHTRMDLAYESLLLRASDGKMCCLGFFGSACGISKGDLRDTPTFEPYFIKNLKKRPTALVRLLRAPTKTLIDDIVNDKGWVSADDCSSIQGILVTINDDTYKSTETKKEQISYVFDKALGVKVKFVP